MEKIVLDTSVLISIFELKIDIFEEIKKAVDFGYELFIIKGTLDELERLIKSPSLSTRQAAKFAQKVVDKKQLKVLETNGRGSVDDQLVDLDGCIVMTADRALKKRLKAKGTRILIIRQSRYVLLE